MISSHGMIRIQVSYLHVLRWHPSDPHRIRIGCKEKTISRWLRLSDRYGKLRSYTDDEIKKVRDIIQVIKGLRDAIK